MQGSRGIVPVRPCLNHRTVRRLKNQTKVSNEERRHLIMSGCICDRLRTTLYRLCAAKHRDLLQSGVMESRAPKPNPGLLLWSYSSDRREVMGDKSPKNTNKAKKQKDDKKAAASSKAKPKQ